MSRRDPGRGDSGFTLVEMAVAMTLGAMLLTGVFVTLHTVQSSWRTSRRQVTEVRHERAGVEMIVRDVRMAGSGYGGRPVITAGISDPAIYPLQPRPGSNGDPDSLVITAGFDGLGTRTTQTMGGASDPLFVADATGFEAGDLVIVHDGPDANLFQVTAVYNGDQLAHAPTSPYNIAAGHAVWPNNGYPAGSRVVRVRRVAYWIDRSDAGARLVRRMDSGETVPVAAGAEDMTIRYMLADGTLAPAPVDPTLIRSVVLQYIPEDLTGLHPVGDRDTLEVRIQPRVIG